MTISGIDPTVSKLTVVSTVKISEELSAVEQVGRKRPREDRTFKVGKNVPRERGRVSSESSMTRSITSPAPLS